MASSQQRGASLTRRDLRLSVDSGETHNLVLAARVLDYCSRRVRSNARRGLGSLR